MSLEKAIASGKEHRKWIGKSGYAKKVSKECRNHGGCSYCEGNRLFKYKKARERVKERVI